MNNRKDYYKILGLEKNASQDDIKKAFRKLSKEWHPDRFVNEPEDKRKEAEEKFKDINEANQVLSDPQKKSRYDNGGSFSFEDLWGANPFGGFNPFAGFNMHVNRPQNTKKFYPPGSDTNIRVHLDIEDIYNYDKPKIVSFNRQVRCDKCNGVGGKGETTCTHCIGTGMFTERRQQGPITIMNQSPCMHCGGTGKIVSEKCDKCGGNGLKNIVDEIDINKEIPRQFIFGENQIVCAPGKGNESRSPEMPNGSLNIGIIHTYDRDKYSIDINGNIYQNINVKYYDCLLGDSTHTFIGCDNGYHSINLPECTKEGTKIECTEMHGAQNGAKYYVVVHIEIPNELNEKEKKELEKIKKNFEKNKK